MICDAELGPDSVQRLQEWRRARIKAELRTARSLLLSRCKMRQELHVVGRRCGRDSACKVVYRVHLNAVGKLPLHRLRTRAQLVYWDIHTPANHQGTFLPPEDDS